MAAPSAPKSKNTFRANEIQIFLSIRLLRIPLSQNGESRYYINIRSLLDFWNVTRASRLRAQVVKCQARRPDLLKHSRKIHTLGNFGINIDLADRPATHTMEIQDENGRELCFPAIDVLFSPPKNLGTRIASHTPPHGKMVKKKQNAPSRGPRVLKKTHQRQNG